MNTSFFDEYPELHNLFEAKGGDRCYEILENLKSSDEKYSKLLKDRVKQSVIIRNKFDNDVSELEKYMDLISEQEIYELNAVYAHAFYDAISALIKLKMLP